jgi:Zn-dependent protease with chaperone function
MSAISALPACVLAWHGIELLLGAVLWAAYVVLARRIPGAGDRFLLLKLSLVSLLALPWVPAVLPESFTRPLPAPWEVLRSSSLPAATLPPLDPVHGPAGWLAGAVWAIMALYLGWLGLCLLRLVRSAHELRGLLRGARRVDVPAAAPVLVADLVPAPATVGFRRPRILIPARLYERLRARELQLILRHEAVHIRRRDALFNALMLLLRAALPANLFVRALAQHFVHEMELSVDAEVLAGGDPSPREYGQLLLDLARQLGSPASAPGALFVARSLIARRIAAMTRPASTTRRPTLLLASFVGLVGLCAAGVSAFRLGPTAWAAGPAPTATAAQPADTLLQMFLVDPAGPRTIAQEDGGGPPLTLAATPVLTGADLQSATLQPGEPPTVSMQLKPAAAARFAAFTGSHLGERMAIVLADKLLVAPVIKSRIDGGRLMLSGPFPDAMRRLVDMLAATPKGAAGSKAGSGRG